VAYFTGVDADRLVTLMLYIVPPVNRCQIDNEADYKGFGADIEELFGNKLR
jgi:hypothetical protein